MIARLTQLCWSRYRLRVGLSMLLLFITGMTGGVTVAAVIPLVESLSQDGAQDSRLSRIFQGLFDTLGLPLNFLTVMVFILVVVVVRAVMLVLLAVLMKTIEVSIERDSKQALFDAVLNTQLTHLYACSFGRVSDALITQTRMVGRLLNFFTRMLTSTIDVLFAGVVILVISWKLTIFVGLFTAVLFLCLRPLFLLAKRWGRVVTDCQRRVQEAAGTTLNGYKTLKSYVREQAVRGHFAKVLGRYWRTEIKLSSVEGVLHAMFEPIVMGVAILMFVLFDFEMAVFVAFVVASTRMYLAIRVMQNMHYKMARHFPALEVYDRMRSQLEAHQYPDETDKQPFESLQDSVVFRDVKFTYQAEGEVMQIGPLDFTIRRGESIGVVGVSGSGKSTTVDLLVGLIDPQSGAILVDGQDLASIQKQSFRRKLAYVAQEPFMLNDTIRRNVDFRREAAGPEAIRTACELAHAHAFIERLPQGYDTVLGEHGVGLSGGERQRIALARALLVDPDILILDEATSALDNESEQKIQQAIAELHGQKTLVIIAHRLSSVRHADRILVFRDGQVVEQGTFDELLALEGHFHRLYQSAG